MAFINFCPTGMVPTKELNPHTPISPEEIIEQVHEAYEVGISIAHLHARDSQGHPTSDIRTYSKILEGVRAYCPDLIVCLSTSGRVDPSFETRSAVIELQPDMASLTLGSLNFKSQASVNEPRVIEALAGKMQSFGVIPEMEVFDLGMVNFGNYLISKGVIKSKYWNILLGNINGLQVSHLFEALREIPSHHLVGVAGLGRFQLPANTMALAYGLGVRVGLEDNMTHKGKPVSNIFLLQRIHRLMKELDIPFDGSNSIRDHLS